MYRFTFNKVLFLILTMLVIGVSCSKSDQGEPMDQGLLEFVAADTPYVLASLSPLPDDVMDSMEPKVDEVLKAYAAVVRAAVEDIAQEELAEGGSEEASDAIRAVGDEVANLMSIEGLRGAGIDRDSLTVFYGNGLLPVMRMRLSDGALMEDTIARIESKSGVSMDVAEIDEVSYRYVVDEEAKIIIAIIGNDIVISIMPATHSERMLKAALGLNLPDRSMADSGELQQLAEDNGFNSYMVILLDITRIASAFIDDKQGTNAEIMALLEHDAGEISDVCKSEIRQVSEIMPRMIGGYSEFDEKRNVSRIIFELREDIAAGLSTLVAPVQGLGEVEGQLFSYGMSLNMTAARDFYSKQLDAMEADPFECEYFADLQAGVATGRMMLQQPVPPIVNGMRGFLAVVDALEGMDLATKQPPTSVDASLLIAMDNPQGLLAMGAMFSPDLATLDLQPDGKPQALALPPISPALANAFIAMTDDALAISVGSDAENALVSLLGADFADPAPFLSMNMDTDGYYGFLAEAMTLSAQQMDEEEELSPEMAVAMADAMKALQGFFSRQALDINFTARGVEMDSVAEMAED